MSVARSSVVLPQPEGPRKQTNSPSGAKLTEATLADQIGVSRGPVREAFRMLEEAGQQLLARHCKSLLIEVCLRRVDRVNRDAVLIVTECQRFGRVAIDDATVMKHDLYSVRSAGVAESAQPRGPRQRSARQPKLTAQHKGRLRARDGWRLAWVLPGSSVRRRAVQHCASHRIALAGTMPRAERALSSRSSSRL